MSRPQSAGWGMVAALISGAILVSCATPPAPSIGGKEVLAMKKEGGLSEEEIVRRVDAQGKRLTLTDDDVVDLVGAGFSDKTINELLKRARDVEVRGHH